MFTIGSLLALDLNRVIFNLRFGNDCYLEDRTRETLCPLRSMSEEF